jgi:Uma2 family endonuclease
MSAVIDQDVPPREPPKQRGEPPWNVAFLYPPQGEWTEEDYLILDSSCENRMLELVDGFLEVLPMPDVYHQRIVGFLLSLMSEFVTSHGLGEVLHAPLPVRLWDRHMREPDLVYLRKGRIQNPRKPPQGADLAIEVVSPGEKNRERDLETKPVEYARAGIQEYWIVDPENESIIVLVLDGTAYREHGVFRAGSKASSVLLVGFEVDVAQVFAAGMGK